MLWSIPRLIEVVREDFKSDLDQQRPSKSAAVLHVKLTVSYLLFFSRFCHHSHGTTCAGIIAGGNNRLCGVGISYNAHISSEDEYGKRRFVELLLVS